MLSKKIYFLFLLTLFLVLGPYVSVVNSAISSCSASVSPTSVSVSGSPLLVFSVTNSDSSTGAVWIKFTSPSANFTVTGASASGWSTTTTSSTATFTSATLPASSTGDFSVSVTTGSSTVSAASWTVQVSDSSGGNSPTTCSGSTAVAIAAATDVAGPQISNIVVSDISSTSAKITWTTDENSNSVVDYGTTGSYGSTKSDSGQTTSHSISIDGLTKNTTYHYNAKSTDSSGNDSESGDNTFVTAKEGSTTTTVTGTTKTVTVTKEIKDTKPPGVLISTDLDKPFEKAPVIEGVATDNSGISKIEYSVDNGENWLPVDEIDKLFAKQTKFSFLPYISEDGDYKIMARAYDATGNVANSKAFTLVIDRLPPQVGASLISAGPLVLAPNSDGLIYTLARLSQKITLSAIGGATYIEILSSVVIASTFDKLSVNSAKQSSSDGEIATGSASPRNDGRGQVFPLVKNSDNGLWSGTLSFPQGGIYELSAESLDGAKNKTERKLNRLVVLPDGKVTSGDAPVEGAVVTLYFLEPSSNKFVVWDGTPYAQENPQKTKSDGSYSFFLPSGKYFFEISAKNLKTTRSRIFGLSASMPINADFALAAAPFSLSFGPIHLRLPDFFGKQHEVVMKYPDLSGLSGMENIAGGEIPYMQLDGESGKVGLNSFRGKTTVMAILSTWSPQSSSQMSALEELAKANRGINVVAVMSQQTVSKASIFKKKGAYSIPVLADSDGLLVEPFNLSSLPTIVILNRKGIIEKVSTTLQTKEEILISLVN